MTKRALSLTLCAFALALTPAMAQECPMMVTVGDFEIVADDPIYDGLSTTFGYCITGLGGDDFHALSNWGLELGQCIQADDLVACSPEPCFYQEDDPNLGITGIKFDDVVVDDGDTACYSFSLEGDWTELVDATTISLKADEVLESGEICGPICKQCEADLSASADSDGVLTMTVELRHNRPVGVDTPVVYQVIDAAGETVHLWGEGPFRLDVGSVYSFDGPIPGLPALAPGDYTVVVRARGMAGWMRRSLEVTVPAP